MPTIIAEDRSKVTNDIDHEKNGSFLAPHSEITSVLISSDRMILRGCNKEIVDPPRATKISIRGVSSKCEDKYNYQKHDCVSIVC